MILEKIKEKNCFEDLDGKKLYVFGAGGIRARKFFSFYGYEYGFEAVLDNNSQKWGKEFFGVKVQSPEILIEMDPESYKVIIAVREPLEVLEQLNCLGAVDVAIYDWQRNYPAQKKEGNIRNKTKRYAIGYIAGVFDLYHIGHLRLFHRAKEQCDYLIVGVTSDDYVQNNKGKDPIIPFEERLQIVRSCKYVDEAVPIPYEFGGTVEAYQKYHFDVQFSGSDYTQDPWWLEQQQWLRGQGADLIFLSYTEQTSSTKIRSSLDAGPHNIIYYPTIVDMQDQTLFAQLANLRQQCDRLVVGIPNDVIMARIFGDGNYTPSYEVKCFLDAQEFIDETMILDDTMLSRREMYRQLHFTKCIYGSTYGTEFQKDQEFFDLLGVEMIPCIPKGYSAGTVIDSLEIALLDLKRHQKIILFGTGVYFERYMKSYGKKYPPAYAVDNDVSKWNEAINGVLVKSPSCLANESVDGCLLVLCSQNYEEMIDQIQTYGDFNYRTLRYSNRIALLDEFGIAVCKEKKAVKVIQDILIQLTEEFDRVCQKYHLHYYAICGTLIGALRHQDIIPWDDDLDVAMPREDFERLRKVVKKEWKDSKYELLMFDEYGGGAFLDFMPRVIYKNAKQPIKVFDKVLGKATADIEDRMFIDIYLLDHASNQEKQHMRTMNLMKKVYGLCMGHRAYIDFSEYESRNTEEFMKQLKLAVHIGSMIPVKILMWMYDRLSKRFHDVPVDDYFMPGCAITCIERRFAKRLFGKGKRVPFRNIEIVIPDDADGLLEAMGYHGYMTPLPESLRRPSHYFNSDIVIWY